MYSNGYNVYKNNSVNYASKEQLLLMLTEGAVKFCKISRQAIVDKDIKKANEALIKTQDIFSELMVSLDTTVGDWAVQLFRVYAFIKEKLVEANIKKSLEIIDEILPLIEDINETWKEAYKRSKR
ncbi:flagellar export chaperone FliS [Clostridium sp. 2-1]|uniref:flagellar export chaperone FliS n=1 Tax=Clostridium TaxID=1485 RepID=UPI000CDA8360|nr:MULTISPECIES: flagellar export chaperone FliS [Clostridium]MBN7573072.1 flagellar export chaperone FliS [Clostridium beijerinckii]MBN7578411.1 flagellar export chaperone FliS [Clostridium beijerinckii]MBN7582846.1 flagellar export chaperone FliS [Clostridium beijerinckii]MBO0519011.1 flagellar export chaperone FliS [Clostridium beijerinckii]POO93276.1 flagellar export chaperone FliS [Clostridium sp. 2-1]